ncbi:MAG TPA: hypothetical protein VNB64_11750 [Solirubrobacteraceae bacterium]|nr:hypothetical protein [Solirubrobacteraceae bacterium]
MTDPPDLDALATDLQAAAQRLRAGELDPEQAAELVDECARLAARAATELERRARAAEPVPGQDSLL